MGLASGQMPMSLIDVSSVYNSDDLHFGKHLLSLTSEGESGGWRPANDDTDEFIKVLTSRLCHSNFIKNNSLD